MSGHTGPEDAAEARAGAMADELEVLHLPPGFGAARGRATGGATDTVAVSEVAADRPATSTGDASGALGLMQHLEARASALEAVPVLELAEALGRVGERLGDTADPLYQEALEALIDETGLSESQASWTLLGMARDWTRPALRQLLERELIDPAVLDAFVPAALPEWPHRHRRARALGRAGGVGVHIGSGSVPGVSLTSLIRGVLVKAPVVLKPGAGDRALVRTFMRAVREWAMAGADRPDGAHAVAAVIAESTAVLGWPGGSAPALETALLGRAGYVVVYGDDATVEQVRGQLQASVPFVGYPHRIGVAVLAGEPDEASARHVAEAVAAFDQRGCVSLQQAFCLGTFTEAERWGAAVAEQLARIDEERPPGPRTADESSAVHQLRTTLELRELSGDLTRLWSGVGTNWTVAVDTPDGVAYLCAARTLRLVPCASVAELRHELAGFGNRIQVAGLAGFASIERDNDVDTEEDVDVDEITEALAAAGAGRIVDVSRMPFPGPGWMHDGQGALVRLLRWCDRGGP